MYIENRTLCAFGEKVLEVVVHLAKHSPNDLKEKIHQFLGIELRKEVYYQVGNLAILLEVYANLSLLLSKQEDFIAFLDEKIKEGGDDWKDKAFYIIQKIKFVDKLGRKEEFEQLVEENLSVPMVKKIKVEQLIAQNKLTQAKELIDVEAVKQEKEYYYMQELFWEYLLLQIAEKEQDKMEIRRINRKLALEKREPDCNYYQNWKATYLAEEWEKIINEEIANISQKTLEKNNESYDVPYHFVLKKVGFILVSERKYQLLWEWVKQGNYEDLMNYVSFLPAEFSKEIVDVLQTKIEKRVENALKRSKYKKIAEEMLFFAQQLPQEREKIHQIAKNSLKNTLNEKQ